MEPEVVTVATRDAQGRGSLDRARLLERSCRRNGFPLTALGVEERWGGCGTKLCLLREYLRSREDGRLVVFLDAYDTVLLPCSDSLVPRFLDFGVPLVFGAEAGCWPDESLRGRYPPVPSWTPAHPDPRIGALRPQPPRRGPFRFLNSGAYMGWAGAILEVLDELRPRPEDDDQALYTRFLLEHPDRAALDYRAVLFHCLYRVGVDDLVVEASTPPCVRSRLTASRPCALHANGQDTSTFNAVARRLEDLDWP